MWCRVATSTEHRPASARHHTGSSHRTLELASTPNPRQAGNRSQCSLPAVLHNEVELFSIYAHGNRHRTLHPQPNVDPRGGIDRSIGNSPRPTPNCGPRPAGRSERSRLLGRGRPHPTARSPPRFRPAASPANVLPARDRRQDGQPSTGQPDWSPASPTSTPEPPPPAQTPRSGEIPHRSRFEVHRPLCPALVLRAY